jgi:hypothetical protein
LADELLEFGYVLWEVLVDMGENLSTVQGHGPPERPVTV